MGSDNDNNNDPREVTAQQRRLAAMLTDVRGWLGRLGHPQWPEAGTNLLDAFNATAADQRFEQLRQSFSAVYKPFDLAHGFINQLLYGEHAIRDHAELFCALTHESIHVLQFNRAAALHADFFNRESMFVICPRDYMLLREAAEREACAVESLFVKQAQDAGFIAAESKAFNWLKATQLEALAAQNPVLGDFLKASADAVMAKPCRDPRISGQVMRLADLYHAYALRDFVNGYNARLPDIKAGRIVFVRLDDDDFATAGGAVHAGAFRPPEAGKLSYANRLLLGEINGILGIGDENSLPTLAGALAQRGLDKTAFLAASRNGALKTTETLACRPPAPY